MRTVERSIDVPGGALVAVLNECGPVSIEKGKAGEVQVRVRMRMPRAIDFSIQLDGGTLRIEATKKPLRDRGMPLWYRPRAEISLRVPEDAPLEVEGRNGAVTASGTAAGGRLVTRNGAVCLEDGGGEWHCETRNGRVRARHVDGDLTASTRNGHIRTERIRGAVTLNVRNGSVVAGFEPPTDSDNELSTRNGAIVAIVENGASATYRATARNGRVDAPDPERSSRREAEGKLGDGSARITLETVNGSITVRRT